MAKHAETLIKGNGLEGRIIVVNSVGACSREMEASKPKPTPTTQFINIHPPPTPNHPRSGGDGAA